MKWMRHKNLSEEDMSFLQGTDLMVKLQSHRLVVIYNPKENQATMKDMGLFETRGLYFVRRLQEQSREDTIEILFEDLDDLKAVEEYLTQYKLGME